MGRISAVFKPTGHVALIPYVTVGYPSPESTPKIVELLAASGSDIIELGIPFSDPLADGVTIQKASFQALRNGVTPELCLELVKKIREKINIPLVFMTYFNPTLNYGLEKFCNDCASSGIDGLIIPDLPPDEGSELEKATKKYGLDLIYLVAPTSTDKRIRIVARHTSGFIYLVSVTGVTGIREKLPADLKSFITRVRKMSNLPLCVGFGISTPEQAKLVAQLADGVIIGSKIIQLMESDQQLTRVAQFIQQLRQSIDEAAKKDR